MNPVIPNSHQYLNHIQRTNNTSSQHLIFFLITSHPRPSHHPSSLPSLHNSQPIETSRENFGKADVLHLLNRITFNMPSSVTLSIYTPVEHHLALAPPCTQDNILHITPVPHSSKEAASLTNSVAKSAFPTHVLSCPTPLFPVCPTLPAYPHQTSYVDH